MTDLWGADLIPWTVSMKKGNPISRVTCCTIRMQIDSCNMLQIIQIWGARKGRGALYINIYIYMNQKDKEEKLTRKVQVTNVVMPECCAPQKNILAVAAGRSEWHVLLEFLCLHVLRRTRNVRNPLHRKKPTLRLSFLSLASCADRSSCRFQAGKSKQRQHQHHDLNHGCS